MLPLTLAIATAVVAQFLPFIKGSHAGLAAVMAAALAVGIVIAIGVGGLIRRGDKESSWRV